VCDLSENAALEQTGEDRLDEAVGARRRWDEVHSPRISSPW
jgi:hypothetical protein